MQTTNRSPWSSIAALATFLACSPLVGSLVAAVDPPRSADAIRSEVLETNAKMTQAANRLDVEAFFAYILEGDGGVIVQNGTMFKTRDEAMQAVKRGFTGIEKIERRFENQRVTVLAPDAALLVAEGATTATLSDGRVLDSRFAVSLVFVRREGKWKLLHGHYSMPVKM